MNKLNANAQPFVASASSSATTTSRQEVMSANAPPFVAAAATRTEMYSYYPVRLPSYRLVFLEDEDERCLFFTFSSGSPLTKQEIYHHFHRRFGNDVLWVYVHKRGERRRDPEFGKIIFTTSALPEIILADTNVVKVWVNKKPLWLKKYVPRSQRHRSMANAV